MSLKSPKMFNSRYSPPVCPGVKFTKASLTRQEFAKEGDVNEIMRKYSAGLAPLPTGNRSPMFGDFSSGLDYQACLDKLIAAQDAFESLPSRVRDRFGNDPARLLDFLADEDNRDEAVKLGLIEAPKPPPVEDKPPVSVPDDKSGGA